MACSVAAVNLTRSHPLSRALYDVLVSSLIVELHSGYAFPWMLQDVVPWGLWGGSRRHDLHHRTGRKHYAKFFGALDGMLRD